MSTQAQPLPSRPNPAGPQLVPETPEQKGSSAKWLIIVGLFAAAGAGYYFWSQREQAKEQAAAAQAGIRTATVRSGKIDQTIRLTGTTSAGKFVSLIAPQIRGSRSGRGRSGFNLAGMQTITVSSVSNVSAGNLNTSGSAGAAGAAGALESSGGGAARSVGGSGATRAASSRVQRPAAPQQSANRSATSGQQQTSGGADGLGSTSSQLGSGMGGGGGTGGGGRGEFSLVLQEVAKPGSMVKKGDVVAEFDRQYMLLRLDDYQSTIETAKAQLAQQKANIELARKTHELNVAKAKAAFEKAQLDMKTLPVLSEIDAERAKLALEEAEAQYKQQLAEGKFIDKAEAAELRYAELEFRSLELEYRRAQQNADRMISKAAIDGMVVMQNINRGGEFAQIQAGDQIYPGQFFMQIVDPTSMVVNATINQVDAERLRVGAKAKVRFDAYPGLELPAHVVNIAAVPRSGGFRASFVREIPVTLKIDAVDKRIIPDLSCSVDVLMESEENASIVPMGAIQQDEEGKTFVYVRQGTGWTRREVEITIENNLEASVKGLKEGEVVALEPPPVPEKKSSTAS
jgi:multidrug efflux pump subunit AcrA (membrane-fusion protein)